jgi:TolA-binding protein
MNRKSEELLLRELSCSSRITNLIADLRRLSIAIVDSEKKNLVDSVMSEIQSSPTMSNSAVYEIDNELQMQINKMKIEIDKMQIDELSKLKEQILINIKKRSEILKYGCLKV